MNKIVKFIRRKFFDWLYLGAIVTILVVIGKGLLVLLDEAPIESRNLNRGILLALISGMIIYIYKQRNKNQ